MPQKTVLLSIKTAGAHCRLLLLNAIYAYFSLRNSFQFRDSQRKAIHASLICQAGLSVRRWARSFLLSESPAFPQACILGWNAYGYGCSNPELAA